MTPRAVLYSRAGCHLCEVMHAGLQPLLHSRGLSLDIVDIDGEPELKRRFGWRIPVFTLDGEVVCEGRFDEDAARDALKLR